MNQKFKIYQVLILCCFILMSGCSLFPTKGPGYAPGINPILSLLELHEIKLAPHELKKKTSLDLFGSNIEDKDLVLLKRLSHLQVLNLGQSRVTSKGIASLKGSFPHLQVLNVTGLNLDKNAIIAIASLPSLKELNLSHSTNFENHLDILPYGLQILDLSSTNVDDLTDLQHLRNLEELYLNNINAKSIEWVNFAKLIKLNRLDINQSGVILKADDWSKHVGHIKILNLRHSHLTKESLNKAHLQKLESIDLSGSTIPSLHGIASILSSPNLKKINLSALKFTKSAHGHSLLKPTFLSTCRLESFILMDSPIQDHDIKFIKNCSKLKHLGLARTNISGKFFKGVLFRNLQFLDLSETKINKKNMPYLSRFKNLKTLWLEDTNTTDASLHFILQLKNLRSLKLNNTQANNLIAHLPSRLKKLRLLEIIETRFSFESAKKLVQDNPQIQIEY